MPDQFAIAVNGRPVRVAAGTTVAAAILIAGEVSFRRSVSGEPRGTLCGMGICFECRVEIDGVSNCRSCQIPCQAGMKVVTV